MTNRSTNETQYVYKENTTAKIKISHKLRTHSETKKLNWQCVIIILKLVTAN